MHPWLLLGANPDVEFTHFWTILSKNRFRVPSSRARPVVSASMQVSPRAGRALVRGAQHYCPLDVRW